MLSRNNVYILHVTEDDRSSVVNYALLQLNNSYSQNDRK